MEGVELTLGAVYQIPTPAPDSMEKTPFHLHDDSCQEALLEVTVGSPC